MNHLERSVAGPTYQFLGDVHLLLPAYNEEASLPSLLERIRELEVSPDVSPTTPRPQRLHVWVVDDGSQDATAAIALSANAADFDVHLVQHSTNRGLGQAVRTGLMAVLDKAADDDAIVVMDADDTHDVGLVTILCRRIAEGADIVIASRFVPGGDDRTAPPFRRWLSRMAAILFRLLFPLEGINDYTSGYRAYRASLVRRAASHYGERLVEERGFAVMVELLLKLRHATPNITEVPMVLRYDRKSSPSKLRLWPTILQYVRLAARDRLAPPPFRTI